MRTKLAVVVAGIGVLCVVRPIVGHHSFSAEFDSTKPFKFTGTVTKVEWMNPHTFFYIDVDRRADEGRDQLGDGNGQPQRADAAGLDAEHAEDRRRCDGRGQQGQGRHADGQRPDASSLSDGQEALRRLEPGQHAVGTAPSRGLRRSRSAFDRTGRRGTPRRPFPSRVLVNERRHCRRQRGPHDHRLPRPLHDRAEAAAGVSRRPDRGAQDAARSRATAAR